MTVRPLSLYHSNGVDYALLLRILCVKKFIYSARIDGDALEHNKRSAFSLFGATWTEQGTLELGEEEKSATVKASTWL